MNWITNFYRCYTEPGCRIAQNLCRNSLAPGGHPFQTSVERLVLGPVEATIAVLADRFKALAHRSRFLVQTGTIGLRFQCPQRALQVPGKAAIISTMLVLMSHDHIVYASPSCPVAPVQSLGLAETRQDIKDTHVDRRIRHPAAVTGPFHPDVMAESIVCHRQGAAPVQL